MKEWSRDNAARRAKLLFYFNPDQNGNYPLYFDPDTGISFIPAPGNSGNPPQYLIQPGGRFTALPTLDRRPPTIKIYPEATVTGELSEPEEPQQKAPELPEPNELTQDTIRAALSQAKREEYPKGAAILELTGAKKGSSKLYQYWSTVWDNL